MGHGNIGEIAFAVEKARETLRRCCTRHGMNASGGPRGYNMVFARDAMIGLIGAASSDYEQEFEKQFLITLDVLWKNRGRTGQIPNAVDHWDEKRKPKATFATIDSTLWFLLGLKAYEKFYGRNKTIEKCLSGVDEQFFWLLTQDSGEDSLPEQLPTSDWQDCFPHKYGHTINTVSLYYACLRAYGKSKQARMVKETALGREHTGLYSNHLGYFLPWRWKDHDGVTEQEDWFDSLGNVLAICTGLADKKHARSILEYIDAKNVNRPYPLRAINPPIRRWHREWHDYFGRCIASRAHWYINGGIWPYIGGFYITALARIGHKKKAREELGRLIEANKLGAKDEWEFNEWIHPRKKKALGSSYHAWSAGAFIFAVNSLEGRALPFLG